MSVSFHVVCVHFNAPPDHAQNKDVFLVTDNRVLKQATWSLATFVRSHRSLHLLAPFTGLLTQLTSSLTHFAHSLETVEILEYVFTL